ncbi:MAG: TetR/AcrR family transcriptional regulator [Balneolaceae bacterium]|nr:TetR/AcrR family transcriptional regulator [Balneolaceae bacterium]
MNKLSRKEREKVARRESIIDAAEELFSEKGFDGATMEDVAERAELGKGTLYLHFKSKSSIFLAICERGSSQLNKILGKVLTEDVSGIEMVKKMGFAYLEFIKKHPIYFSAFIFHETLMDDDNLAGSKLAAKCEDHAREAMAYIVRALQIGMQDGSIRETINPREMGLIIWGASKGVVHMAFLKESRNHLKILDDVSFSLDSLLENLITLIGAGLQTSDSQSLKNVTN